ncbi:tyrosine-type recombinase/integrase [Bacillus sp. PS108]|uniref:tyrosine-type recombinase/integrase n=1 Tax=Bacillus sp. PS108 TaxID=2954725 RepID=UPI002E7768D1|nr:tyrosine-type recombinase/integrase [Bacillus subtilis]
MENPMSKFRSQKVLNDSLKCLIFIWMSCLNIIAYEKEKLLLSDAWEGGEHQYVFHSGKGKPYYYTTPTAKWTKIKKKYGLKDVRLHDLRHTMVALLMEAGESLSCYPKKSWTCQCSNN